jgi:hypothetical protein
MYVKETNEVVVKFIRWSRLRGKALVSYHGDGQEPTEVWLGPDDLLKVAVTFEIDRRVW